MIILVCLVIEHSLPSVTLFTPTFLCYSVMIKNTWHFAKEHAIIDPKLWHSVKY